MKKIIVSVVVVFVLLLGIIYFVIKPEQTEQKEVSLSYQVNNAFLIYEDIPLTEEEQEEIYHAIASMTWEEVAVDLAFMGEYQLKCSIGTLIFDKDNIEYGLWNDKIVSLGSLKEKILEIIEQKEIEDVLFYVREDTISSAAAKVPLTKEEQEEIKESFEKEEKEEIEPMNLSLSGKYILVVDSETIYFDSMNGYALYQGKLIKLSSQFMELFQNYIK